MTGASEWNVRIDTRPGVDGRVDESTRSRREERRSGWNGLEELSGVEGRSQEEESATLRLLIIIALSAIAGRVDNQLSPAVIISDGGEGGEGDGEGDGGGKSTNFIVDFPCWCYDHVRLLHHERGRRRRRRRG